MSYPQELSCYKAFKSVVMLLHVFVELVVTEMIGGFWISKWADIAYRERSTEAHGLLATLLPQITFWCYCSWFSFFLFFFFRFSHPYIYTCPCINNWIIYSLNYKSSFSCCFSLAVVIVALITWNITQNTWWKSRNSLACVYSSGLFTLHIWSCINVWWWKHLGGKMLSASWFVSIHLREKHRYIQFVTNIALPCEKPKSQQKLPFFY